MESYKIYLASCLRCKGDVELNKDMWEEYLKCLQCGQTWYDKRNGSNSNGNQNPMSSNGADNAAGLEAALAQPTNELELTLDKNIVVLDYLNNREDAVQKSTIQTTVGVYGENLENILTQLENHEYILSHRGRSSVKKYDIAPDGVDVLREYTRITGEDGSPQFSSYDFVDKDGKLTEFGLYAVKTSEVLAKFVKKIHGIDIDELSALETELAEVR